MVSPYPDPAADPTLTNAIISMQEGLSDIWQIGLWRTLQSQDHSNILINHFSWLVWCPFTVTRQHTQRLQASRHRSTILLPFIPRPVYKDEAYKEDQKHS